MATDNVALSRRIIEDVWNKGTMEACDGIVDGKQLFHDPLVGDVRGVDGFKQHVRNFRAAFPDLTFTIEDIGAAGDTVYLRFVARGTNKGSFLGIPATNKRGSVAGMAIDRFQGGKIVEAWTSYDTLGMIQQLGFAPALDKLRAAPTAAAQPH